MAALLKTATRSVRIVSSFEINQLIWKVVLDGCITNNNMAKLLYCPKQCFTF